MTNWTLTVSDLNEYVRRSLAADPILRLIRLRGEISGFKLHVSGHWYFTLKDDKSRINCVMFRQSAQQVSFRPQDGMRVVLEGTVGLYTASGMYQFYAEKMEQDGVGALYLKLEELKQKLMREGLFDASRKRPLPLLPRKVGIVTARTGAVIHDIATVSRRRHPGVQLVLRPAQVQGEGAAKDIAQGIEEIALLPGVDVIIVGRGGGSVEDLWAFNEEVVARAIYRSRIPVISAVGHEPDVTISDYVADLRAATPSNAAELAVPDRAELAGALDHLARRLERGIAHPLATVRQKLERLGGSPVLTDPSNYVRERRLLLDYHSRRLLHGLEQSLAGEKGRLGKLAASLDALSPLKVLGRGYAIARSEDGTVITSTQQVAVGDVLDLRLREGTLACRVEERK